MATLQVKGMDDALYKALAARAASDNRSISQEVVTLLQAFLSRPGGSPADATEAFLALAGTWQDTRSARAIAADIKRSRRNRKRGSTVNVFD